MASNQGSEENKDDGMKKALIIGISVYQDKSLEPLPFCKNDAEEMYGVLTSSKLQFKTSDSTKMIGELKEREMKKAIVEFFKDPGIRSQDTLLFYFAGHGITDDYGDVFMASSETDSKNPINGGFPFQELTKLMNASYSTRITTILDCCHSGALELAAGRGDPADAAKKALNNIEDKSNALKQGRGKCLLAASESTQRAYEIKEKNQGIFTYYLLEGLKGKPQSVDEYGNVTVDRLADYVYDTISSLPPEKKPNQMPIRKAEGGGRIILAHYPDLAKRQQQPTAQKDDLLQLLTDGKIDEFNEIRKRDNYSTLNLDGIDLSKRNLKAVNLNAVNLSRAKITGADLSTANLTRAMLFGANLSHAKLSNAKLSGANLFCANLFCANLFCANFFDANLSRTILSGANLSRANLTNANLSGANLSRAKISNADLSGANLSGANLSRANLTNAKLSNAKLSNANLSRANLSDTDLSGAKLSDTDLSNADLSDAKLFGAYLSGAYLFDANLSRTILSDANLSGADLTNAQLSDTDLSNADLSDANLVFSLLIGVKSPDNNEKHNPLCGNANFNNAIIDSEILCSYFHNGNAQNVPPAVRDKKELRKKLEERGFIREKIDWYLSFSSL